MSEQQKLAETPLADVKALKGSADELAGLSLQRRTLLFGAAAVAAGTLSTRPPPRLRRLTCPRHWPNSAPRFRATSTANTSTTLSSHSFLPASLPASVRSFR